MLQFIKELQARITYLEANSLLPTNDPIHREQYRAQASRLTKLLEDLTMV